VQVGIRETNESEPPKTRRYESSVVETRAGWLTWDKSVECLMMGRTATGVEGA
jgi:hypothetical protein